MIDKIQILNFLGLDLDLENQIDFKKDINFFRNVVCNLFNSIRKSILLRTKKDVGSACINYKFGCVIQYSNFKKILFPLSNILSKFVNSSLPFKVGLLNYLFHSVKNKIYFRSNVPDIYFSYLASFKSRIQVFISRIQPASRAESSSPQQPLSSRSTRHPTPRVKII